MIVSTYFKIVLFIIVLGVSFVIFYKGLSIFNKKQNYSCLEFKELIRKLEDKCYNENCIKQKVYLVESCEVKGKEYEEGWYYIVPEYDEENDEVYIDIVKYNP